MPGMNQNNNHSEFDEKIIRISRVSKKTKGGNKMGFSVLVVVGDKRGKVGIGLGKAGDVMSAMKKGAKRAKKKMITIPMDGTTIPFPIRVKEGAGEVLLKPAPQGSGVIAGGPVRAVVEAAGIRDISSKIMGSDNQASSVYATFEALRRIKVLVDIKGIKLKSIAEMEAEEERKIREMQAKAKHDAPVEAKPKNEAKPVVKAAPAKAKPAAKPVAKPAAKKTE
jgi:small subunit ribosomal protein S5